MTDIRDHRRRRALYRAQHRGTKEMDWLLGRYAAAQLPAMDEPGLGLFEELLELPDTDLHSWILDPAVIDEPRFQPLVMTLRAFHGLTV